MVLTLIAAVALAVMIIVGQWLHHRDDEPT